MAGLPWPVPESSCTWAAPPRAQVVSSCAGHDFAFVDPDCSLRPGPRNHPRLGPAADLLDWTQRGTPGYFFRHGSHESSGTPSPSKPEAAAPFTHASGREALSLLMTVCITVSLHATRRTAGFSLLRGHSPGGRLVLQDPATWVMGDVVSLDRTATVHWGDGCTGLGREPRAPAKQRLRKARRAGLPGLHGPAVERGAAFRQGAYKVTRIFHASAEKLARPCKDCTDVCLETPRCGRATHPAGSGPSGQPTLGEVRVLCCGACLPRFSSPGRPQATRGFLSRAEASRTALCSLCDDNWAFVLPHGAC